MSRYSYLERLVNNMKFRLNWLLIGTITVIVLFIIWLLAFSHFGTREAEGTYIPKVNLCHCEQPDSDEPFQCQTLNIAVPAAAAHLLQHDADYAGVCQEEPTPTPTPTEEPEVCEDESATNYGKEEECEYEEPTPTPTDQPDPTATPSNVEGPGDGRSDGRTESLGCLNSSCTQSLSPYDGQPVFNK